MAHDQAAADLCRIERVKRLLAGFAGSSFVTAVENERFDTSQNGILRFDFTLVINPRQTL